MDFSPEDALIFSIFNFDPATLNTTSTSDQSLNSSITTPFDVNVTTTELVNTTTDLISTTNPSYKVPPIEVLKMCIYITEGIILLICNGLLITTIMRHQALRMLKEFIVLAGLATADSLVGLGTMFAGIHRLPILFANEKMVPTSRSWCFFKLHSWLWVYGVPTQSFMLLVVSIDRFLCVSSPKEYIKYQKRMMWVIAAVFGLLAIQFIVMGVRVQSETTLNVTIYCYENMAVLEWDYVIYYNIQICAALGSVLVYGAVIVGYKKRFARVAADETKDFAMKDDIKRQREFTKATTISCFCTLVLYAIPKSLMMLSSFVEGMEFGDWAVWALIVSNINPMLNVLIFFKKQKEFRIGVKALIANKTMPPNIRMWQDKFTLNMLFNPDAEMVDDPVT